MTALRLFPLPPPEAVSPPAAFLVLPDGTIGEQYQWNGYPSRLIGFQARFDRLRIDVDVEAFLADPDKAIGLYPVFVDAAGDASPYLLVVDRVEEEPEPRRWWIEMKTEVSLEEVSLAAMRRMARTTSIGIYDWCDLCGARIGYYDTDGDTDIGVGEGVVFAPYWVTEDGRALCGDCGGPA